MNALDKATFKRYIQAYDFTTLFNELGWDYLNEVLPKKAGDKTFSLKAVAHKEGFRIFVCNPDEEGKIPDSNIRKKIHTEISRLFFEHLIIFIDRDKTTQVWQLVIREQGKPHRVKQVTWYRHQEPELLYQRLSGVFFTIDETDKLTIVDVTHRLKENFGANAEKVTKKFYDIFKKEHTRFLKFLKGIEDNIARDWYASLMLNRLMFCYFIQRKGFLNNDRNYLSNKLKEVQAEKGKDKFFKFYYDFLKTLFHEGLGSPNHSKELKKLIGNIPYLNGGLFDTHRLEMDYPKIQIDDAAFEHIFDFFDEWDWHLDVRPDATGKEINPDVIGYIFEKYINDRAQMGAYYTKEDITQYISKNCVIPFLFDETQRNYNKAFSPDGWLWTMVKESNDHYIYDAVKHGINQADLWADLPKDVKAGLDPNQPDLVEKRRCWNRPAPSEAGLPTEIWREVIDRRKRYGEVRQKIENGEVTHINDFITYNLNICQLAQDVIANTSDPKLIQHFYIAIAGRIRDPKNSSIEPRQGITILDPTCGSGAFLFSAMEMLKPLYDECLQRMDEFVQEHPGKHPFFEQVMADVDNIAIHPNRDYFVYKSIILRNLYGVDIMNEAVEIAKLRLFLKLVATVEADYNKPNMGLEPLPDVDFNIRAGNTLVGFAALKDVERAVEGHLLNSQLLKKEIEDINEQAEKVGMAYERFTDSQLIIDSPSSRRAKTDLDNLLQRLNERLNIYQAQLYGIDVQGNPHEYDKWKTSYQPFHWFAEFYEIVHKEGGFDVIIGNPPYVEYSKVKKDYTIKGYETEFCGNLYAYVMERSTKLNSSYGHIGLIVPMSITSIREYIPLRKYIEKEYQEVWATNHAIRPTCLFTGVSQRVSIVLCTRNGSKKHFSTDYLRTFYPNHLFQCFTFVEREASFNIDNVIPKLSKEIEISILRRMIIYKPISEIDFSKTAKNEMFFKDYGETYWIFPMNFTPWLTPVKSYNSLKFSNKALMNCVVAYLNSSLFYWFYSAISDCWHFGKWHISKTPIGFDKMEMEIKINLESLGSKLMTDFSEHRIIRYDSRIGGDLYEYKVSSSKPIIDEIDKVLAEHYGFTNEELDFIINYDIKYRMGKELEGEDEE